MPIHVLEASLNSLVTLLGLVGCETCIKGVSLAHIKATLLLGHSLLNVPCELAFGLGEATATGPRPGICAGATFLLQLKFD